MHSICLKHFVPLFARIKIQGTILHIICQCRKMGFYYLGNYTITPVHQQTE